MRVMMSDSVLQDKLQKGLYASVCAAFRYSSENTAAGTENM